METRSEHRCFEGTQGYYRHDSAAIGLPMQFSVYQPIQATKGLVPGLLYLAGLTCTEETFMIKAGAQRIAAELGVMLITCDTSPRDTGISGEADDWEFGAGAGFYLNATEAPWSRYFRMYDYILQDLLPCLTTEFPLDPARLGLCGHSMGGHGALVLGLRNPEVFRSLSAFAPICAPASCPWGAKAFPRYLGEDYALWQQYDATELLQAQGPRPDVIRVDQGLADPFLSAGQLLPEKLETACEATGQRLELHRHDGYDHGYFFISTFVEAHLRFHAAQWA